MNPFGRSARRAKQKPTAVVPVQQPARPPLTEATPQFQNLVGAFRGLDETAQLLQIGLFPGAAANVVATCSNFVATLRERAHEDLKAHEEFETYFGGQS